MRTMSLAAALVTLLTLFAGEARGADRVETAAPLPLSPPRFDDSPIHFETRLGFGTSVGLLGFVAEIDVHERLALGAGLGTNGFGRMWGVHARWRPVIGRPLTKRALHAFTLELAVSGGRFDGREGFGELAGIMCAMSHDEPMPGDPCYDPLVTPEYVLWAQLDPGWEVRFSNRVTLRASLGVAAVLTDPTYVCEMDNVVVPCNPSDRFAATPTLAIGYAF